MHASQFVVVGSGLIALVISVILWPVVGYAITVVHEGGHALAASMMGGTVTSLTVGPGHNGETRAKGLGPLGAFVFLLGGYVGPSVFGAAGAMLLTRDHVRMVLWLSVFFLLLALLASANYVARAAIVLVGALIVLVIRRASDGQEVFFAYTWIWFLLFGGFGHVLVLQQVRSAGGDTMTDAYQLRRMTFLPASLFSGVFWLFSAAALVFGAVVMLHLYHPHLA
ncbi:M50 family metallopeptidase [Dactylosporangium sp. CS-033363]|uniref:M50 family metallopeptidase n=1 Tax=Dactylosporangium sp. CS-033363 TaxID=3239935 RepID=UPI003D9287FC